MIFSVGIWRYEDSTAVSSLKFWDADRPAGQRCVEMWHNGRWRDDDCSKQKHFLCEKQGKVIQPPGWTIVNTFPSFLFVFSCVITLPLGGVRKSLKNQFGEKRGWPLNNCRISASHTRAQQLNCQCNCPPPNFFKRTPCPHPYTRYIFR